MQLDTLAHNAVHQLATKTTQDLAGKSPFGVIPQNAQSATYTCVLADAGKHIYETGAVVINIPANTTTAFEIGAAITFVAGANPITIAILTDSLRQAGTGSTGNRTLAAFGIATAIKVTATEWRISGVGLS